MQLIIQINNAFIAFCLFLPEFLRMVMMDWKYALLKIGFCSARSLHPETSTYIVWVYLVIWGSLSFLLWNASWIKSFFNFFYKIYYCSYLIIRSFYSTFDSGDWHYRAFYLCFGSLNWIELMRLLMLTLFVAKKGAFLELYSPLFDSGIIYSGLFLCVRLLFITIFKCGCSVNC